ncbi:hypothetical protein KCU73_g151, partial [Aureobasidium melanogenum]
MCFVRRKRDPPADLLITRAAAQRRHSNRKRCLQTQQSSVPRTKLRAGCAGVGNLSTFSMPCCMNARALESSGRSQPAAFRMSEFTALVALMMLEVFKLTRPPRCCITDPISTTVRETREAACIDLLMVY